MWNMVVVRLLRSFHQQASGQIFVDDVNGIPSTSDICFIPKYTALSRDACRVNKLYRPWLKNSAGFMYKARTRHLFPIVGQYCTFLSLFHPGYQLWYNNKKVSSVQLFFTYAYKYRTVHDSIQCTCVSKKALCLLPRSKPFLTEKYICIPLMHNTYT